MSENYDKYNLKSLNNKCACACGFDEQYKLIKIGIILEN